MQHKNKIKTKKSHIQLFISEIKQPNDQNRTARNKAIDSEREREREKENRVSLNKPMTRGLCKTHYATRPHTLALT